jgi:RNA polymerase sigma-70 factor (ECF subfamily)
MMPPTALPGDQINASIETLYRTHHDALLRYLSRLVGDRMAAEDLCQETFLKALRGWSEQPQIVNAHAWLYRIATNTAYDYLRRRKRIQFTSLSETSESLGAGPSMETRLHEQEPVQRVLAELPFESRRLLMLSSYAGHSTHELATALDCSATAVRLRLFRARERFRKIYLKMGMHLH